MKITLIQPKAGRYNPSYIHEPLNLGYLASYLKANGFPDVQILIGAFHPNEEGIIAEATKSDVVGFTATSPMMKNALFLAERIKAINPETITVFGGAHPSITPEQTLRHPEIDFVICGEGEQTFLELMEAMENGKEMTDIKGLSYKDNNGKTIHNPLRSLIENIDLLPFPDREAIQQPLFLEIGHKKYGDRGAWILSSRGCPFDCTYCASNKIWTRKWRPRSAKNILQEIIFLKDNYNVDRINFADDTFTVSKKRVLAFCNLLLKEEINISWACNARVDTVDEELFVLMKRAGCVEVWMGVESGSQEILKEIKKDISIKQIKEGFHAAKAAGLTIRGYFMIGSRSESYETIKETECLIETIQPDLLAFSVMTPYPGCEEFDIWQDTSDLTAMDWSEVDLLETEAVLLETKYLSKNELKSEHLRLRNKYVDIWRI